MRADGHSAPRGRRGFVIGELLVAILLLAVAVSSLAALMYSVSHRSEMTEQAAVCAGKAVAANGQCAQHPVGAGPRALRSTCVADNGEAIKGCTDSGANPDNSSGTIVKTKTDSASLALITKKEKPARTTRPNRGFIR
jgi:type II secretory pathway component PulJ